MHNLQIILFVHVVLKHKKEVHKNYCCMQELREVAASIEPKHEKEVNELISSYQSLYSKWLFVLRSES